MKFAIYLISLVFLLTPSARAWEDFQIYKPGELKIIRSSQHKSQDQNQNQSSCRSRIAQIVCLTATKESDKTKTCLPNSSDFAAPFEKIYDILPPKLQKTFCGLDALLIEEDMVSLAYAGLGHPSEAGTPVFIGVRKSLVEFNYDVTSVLGWKEQRAFGIEKPPYVHAPEGPRVDVALPYSQSSLHYIIVHELGHILDFLNQANQFAPVAESECAMKDCPENYFDHHAPVENSWGSLSWKFYSEPKSLDRFPLWNKLCFYNCNEHLTIEDIEPFYAQLATSGFVSTYAAISPYEDFAESVAFYVMSQPKDFSYSINTRQSSYSLDLKWKQLAQKNLWLESFFSKDLKYPKGSF